jgi:tetratricopeptide (TPR) repeat protein
MQALVISREIPDRRMEGNVLSNLGAAHAALDQVETAIGFYDQALTISREIGDRRLEGMVVGGLGTAHAARGRVQTAMGFYRQALSISHGLRDGRNGGILLGNLGTAYVDLGQVETAISFYEEALAVSRKIGNLPHIQWLLPALAEALVIIGDLTALESVIAAPEIAETAQLLRVRLIVAATVAETDEQFEKTTRVLSDGSEELAFFVELCGRARRIVADGSTDALEGLDEVTRSAVLEVAKQIRERRARG